MSLPETLCPLCHSLKQNHYYRDKSRSYLQCQNCALVFVPAQQHLNPQQEKQIYDLHENDMQDPGYQRFLSRLSNQVIKHISTGSKGIDYGCGPAPLLAKMLLDNGYQMDLYDPFYHPSLPDSSEQYDFICCSEAIEHFYSPAKEWRHWQRMLKPNGWLCIMTKRVLDVQRFANWHYKNDPTHVCFFSEATFAWLAEKYHFRMLLPENDVVLMQKLSPK